jgi:hypothetical protein
MSTNEDKQSWWASLFEAALATPRSWMPLIQEHPEEVAWALEIAEARAMEIDAPLDPVRHVRGYMTARLGGFPVHWSMLDHNALVYTAALFLQAMQRDLGPAKYRGARFHNAADSGELLRLQLGALFAGNMRSDGTTSQKEHAS